jgi:hypothetical protein
MTTTLVQIQRGQKLKFMCAVRFVPKEASDGIELARVRRCVCGMILIREYGDYLLTPYIYSIFHSGNLYSYSPAGTILTRTILRESE